MHSSTKLFVASGVVFLLTVSMGFIFFKPMLKFMVNRQKALRKGTEMYDMYLKLPFPLELCVSFFNVTNPKEIEQGGIPDLKEVGPYCYITYKEKRNIIVNDSEDSLSYIPYETFFYDKKMTAPLSHNDYVTIVHPVLMGVISVVDRTVPQTLGIVNKALSEIFPKSRSIFLTDKVRNILFDGMTINCTSTNIYVSTVCSEIKKARPDMREREKNIYLISVFGELNGTVSPKRVKVLRGSKNPSIIGEVIEFKNESKLSAWSTDECNTIHGVDAWIFPTFLENTEYIRAFSIDLIRTVQFNHVEDVRMNGVNAREFHATLGDMDSNPEEKCYCPTPTTCLKKGMMDLFNCTGVPVYVSLPHFLECDKFYQDSVKGLNPKRKDHIVKIIFEPMTAVPLFGVRRIQLNFMVEPLAEVPRTHNVTKVIHPVMWFEEGVELKGKYLKQLTMSILALKILKIVLWVLLVASLAGMGLAGFLRYKSRNLVKVTHIQSNELSDENMNDNGHTNPAINLNGPDKF